MLKKAQTVLWYFRNPIALLQKLRELFMTKPSSDEVLEQNEKVPEKPLSEYDPFKEHAKIINNIYPVAIEGFLQTQGFVHNLLPEDLASELRIFTEKAPKLSFDNLYLMPCKSATRSFDKDVKNHLNKNIDFVDPRACYEQTKRKDQNQNLEIYTPVAALKNIGQLIVDKCSEVVGAPFAIVGIRGWLTKPGSERFGPNKQHSDGFPPGHLKVMVYPNPLNEDYGYLQIENKDIKSENSSFVIFENTERLHSGVPGDKSVRISWEYTLMKVLSEPTDEQRYFFSVPHGHEERHLGSPHIYYVARSAKSIDVRRIDVSTEGKNLSLGSGHTTQSGWLCYDELDVPGVHKLQFDENTRIPLIDNTVQLVYSSHCLEHLTDETVGQLFCESRRILSSTGYLLIKIPDVEMFIDAYRNDDAVFFNKPGRYGVDGVAWSWVSRDVDVNPANIVSVMICGYWNNEYGDHFSGRINKSENAYHGPVVMRQEELRELLLSSSVRDIVAKLRVDARQEDGFKQYNHQNAWSRTDMATLLNKHGFNVVTMNKKQILTCFRHVREIEQMADWSMYVLAEPASKR